MELADGGTKAESVSEFTRRVKQLLEGGMKACWVRGEVSNLRAQASGHVYFSLKDAGAQLSAVLFRGDAARQAIAWPAPTYLERPLANDPIAPIIATRLAPEIKTWIAERLPDYMVPSAWMVLEQIGRAHV